MTVSLRRGAGATVLLAALVAAAAPAGAAPPAKKPVVAVAPAGAATPAKKPAAAGPNVPLLPGAGSKEPINIDADKLDYFDKEQKLVYTGGVVAVQGDSTLKASVLSIFLQKQDAGQGGATAPQPAAQPGIAPGGGSSVKHMDAEGPVTLISKDQVGTGDGATYDKGENKVYLSGNVTLTQGTNVTQGDRLIYDLTSGQAQVFSGATNGGRVTSVFTPGSDTPGGPPKAAPAAATKKASTAKRRTADAPKASPTTDATAAEAQ